MSEEELEDDHSREGSQIEDGEDFLSQFRDALDKLSTPPPFQLHPGVPQASHWGQRLLGFQMKSWRGLRRHITLPVSVSTISRCTPQPRDSAAPLQERVSLTSVCFHQTAAEVGQMLVQKNQQLMEELEETSVWQHQVHFLPNLESGWD